MYCIEPEPIFYGSTRTIAAAVLIALGVLSIGLQSLFIVAIYKMAGWESNFSFTLLICLSLCSLLRFLNGIVCHAIALSYLDFCTNHHIFTALGSIDLSVYFTVIIITVLMTAHRMVYTLFATRASTLLPPILMKGVLVFVGLVFIALFIVTHPNDVHYHYVPNLLSYDDLAESTWEILRLAKKITNYTLGVSNLIAYSIIFGYLYWRHSLSFSRNNELRMTVQITLFVIIEIIYFVYWEFIETKVMTVAGLLGRTIINMAFYDSIILPYLLINKRIQQRMVEVICGRANTKCRSQSVSINRLFIRPSAYKS
ncbi:hypothetical protein Y032_0505g2670 [Ancylostoma ceylanicum]|uniref:7TM GPCR serpentine receptor class x (Srx) domain-containing protein n=1 Tax=Ancylostoma ceylanicum TaxID=53326 RepID=A0A016WV10_9BILA|nr:hypothetical protein Y032_0505g2670 [Ancylostoma ceylanicum]